MILIILILSSIALALFVSAMIYAICPSTKVQKFRRSISNINSHVICKDSKFWERFEPTEYVVLNGYIGTDDYATEFYRKIPVKKNDADGNFDYFEAADGDDAIPLPVPIVDELRCINSGEVRKVSIKFIVGEVEETN